MSTSFPSLKAAVIIIIHESVGQVVGSANVGQAWLISVRLFYVCESPGKLLEQSNLASLTCLVFDWLLPRQYE